MRLVFEKKDVWVLVALLVVGVVVHAFGTNNPSTFGHSGGEISVNYQGNPLLLQDVIGSLDARLNNLASSANVSLDCITSSSTTCPSGYAGTGSLGSSTRCCRITATSPTSQGQQNQTETIYIGWDNNGDNDPDCWAIQGQGFVACGNPLLPPPAGGLGIDTRAGCVDAAKNYYNNELINGVTGGWSVASWSVVPSQNGACPAGSPPGTQDATSDKISVMLAHSA